MGHDFPFNIDQVAGLLDLTERRRYETHMTVDCPFCRKKKKGKLDINFVKDTFRCNYNPEQHSGGMLELYADYYGITTKQAYQEVCEALRTGTGQRSGRQIKHKQEFVSSAVERVDLDTCDQTYRMLLSMLTLSATHREHLSTARGLTEEQIRAQGYRSTPAFGFPQLAKRLADSGCTLKGVSGFYTLDDGTTWTAKFSAYCSGILIPLMSLDGRIQRLQIRLDRPIGDTKYMFFSSSDKLNGACGGSPVHFIGSPMDKVVYLTEGGIKGNIAHALTGKSFGCVAGATQHEVLKPFFEQMRSHGVEMIVECYDMDSVTRS